MFNRVLILSASVGSGHVRAAQAIEKAFRQLDAAREVRHVDALAYTNKLFRRLYQKTYIDIVNSVPELFGWIYEHTNEPWKSQRERVLFEKLNTRPFVKMLQQYQPDLAVCTHFLPSEIIASLHEDGRLTTRQAIVVTDLDVHAMWLCRYYEQYFVAVEEAKLCLEKMGIDPARITMSGIPIDPVFAEHKDKRQMRLKHGLEPDLPAILVSAGGFGVGPVEKLIASLQEMKHRAQIVAICGKSEELKARVEQICREMPHDCPITIKVVGFTTDMDEYMSACDIVVGKPGGLTSSEAMAKGLVFVIVNPIPGQEERNADHMLEEGAAVRCNNLPVLAYKMDRLLDDPERFASLQTNARRLAKPHAARTIVEKLLRMAAQG